MEGQQKTNKKKKKNNNNKQLTAVAGLFVTSKRFAGSDIFTTIGCFFGFPDSATSKIDI